jgi:serine/threonine-protein kinase
MATESDGLIAWPSKVGGAVPDPAWSMFCNGVPGQLMLYTAAFERTSEPEYRALARTCAQTVFALRTPNPTLCCGTAGHALALDMYARATGDEQAHRWSRTRLRDAITTFQQAHTRTPSLFQGSGGVALLAAQAARRRPLTFPFE